MSHTKSKTYMVTNTQLTVATFAAVLSFGLTYASVPFNLNKKVSSVKSIQLGTSCKNNTYKNFKIVCIGGTVAQTPKNTCVSIDKIKSGAEIVCSKKTGVTPPRSNIKSSDSQVSYQCNDPREYRDILHCYASLENVRNHLIQISLRTPNNTILSGDQFLLNLLQIYNGNATNAEKEQFIAQNIQNNQFNHPKEAQYIFRVLHMLWFERNGNAPWSIRDYTQNDVDILVWTKGLYQNNRLNIPNVDDSNKYFDDRDPWEHLSFPAFTKLFSFAHSLQSNTHEQTAINIIRWYKKNFFHAYNDENVSYGWERYNDNIPGQQVFSGDEYSPVSLERLFEERISGCHDAATVSANIFRSINIPAIDTFRNSGHLMVYLPTLNKFIHGDHIVERAVAVEANRLLLTPEQLDLIDLPPEQYSEYNSYLINLYPLPEQQMMIGGQILHRNENNLFVQSPRWCSPLSSETLNILQQELPEFHLHPSSNEACYTLVGDSLPIRSIDQL